MNFIFDLLAEIPQKSNLKWTNFVITFQIFNEQRWNLNHSIAFDKFCLGSFGFDSAKSTIRPEIGIERGRNNNIPADRVGLKRCQVDGSDQLSTDAKIECYRRHECFRTDRNGLLLLTVGLPPPERIEAECGCDRNGSEHQKHLNSQQSGGRHFGTNPHSTNARPRLNGWAQLSIASRQKATLTLMRCTPCVRHRAATYLPISCYLPLTIRWVIHFEGSADIFPLTFPLPWQPSGEAAFLSIFSSNCTLLVSRMAGLVTVA